MKPKLNSRFFKNPEFEQKAEMLSLPPNACQGNSFCFNHWTLKSKIEPKECEITWSLPWEFTSKFIRLDFYSFQFLHEQGCWGHMTVRVSL